MSSDAKTPEILRHFPEDHRPGTERQPLTKRRGLAKSVLLTGAILASTSAPAPKRNSEK